MSGKQSDNQPAHVWDVSLYVATRQLIISLRSIPHRLEVSPRCAVENDHFLTACSYTKIERHDTNAGLKKIAKGVPCRPNPWRAMSFMSQRSQQMKQR